MHATGCSLRVELAGSEENKRNTDRLYTAHCASKHYQRGCHF